VHKVMLCGINRLRTIAGSVTAAEKGKPRPTVKKSKDVRLKPLSEHDLSVVRLMQPNAIPQLIPPNLIPHTRVLQFIPLPTLSTYPINISLWFHTIVTTAGMVPRGMRMDLEWLLEIKSPCLARRSHITQT